MSERPACGGLPAWLVAALAWILGADDEWALGDLEERECRRRRQGRRTFWRLAVDAGSTVAWGLPRRIRRAWRMSTGVRASWLDFKLGLRMLRKYPSITLVSILPMALAIAVAAGAYAATAGILRPQLPFPDGDRIVGVELWNVATRSSDARAMRDFAIWRKELTSVSDLGAFEAYSPNLMLDGLQAEPVYGSKISASAFRVTRVPPLLGRPLLEEDERLGATDVIVLGYGLWTRVFGGDPELVGRTVQLGESPFEVVGVMPSGFAFPYNDEIWVPLRADEQQWESLDGPQIFVFGRLRDGANITAAQAELDVITRRRVADDSEAYRFISARVVPYGTNLWEGPTLVLTGLRFILVLLLLVVCSTVGVLVFVRNLAREREVTMRFYLGASRTRIVAQLFTESLVMASSASVLGLLLMLPGLRWLYATAAFASAGEGGLPFWVRPQLTPGTFYFVAALTLLSAAVAGLLPALTLTERRGLLRAPRLVSGGGSIRLGPKGTMAIAAQTALTVGLLALMTIVWGNMVIRLSETNPIHTRSYLTAVFRPGQVPATNEEKDRVLRRVLESSTEVAARLAAASPEVTGVTLGSSLPGQSARRWAIEVDGRVDNGELRSAYLSWVDTGYFSVLNIPVIAGRTFELDDLAGDGSSPGVAIINQSFAKQWFGDERPLGKRVRFVGAVSAYPGDPAQHPWAEIVGVVSDVGMGLRYSDPRALYLPLRTGTYPLHMAVRSREDPTHLNSELRMISTAVDPWLRLGGVAKLKSVVDRAQAVQRTIFAAVLLATLTALALSLSAIYAVVSFLVAQRTQEIGIRIALGGSPGRVVACILSRSLRPLALGIAAGMTFMVLLRIVTLSSVSWKALLMVSTGALAAGITAGLVPALKTGRVQPTAAIRSES